MNALASLSGAAQVQNGRPYLVIQFSSGQQVGWQGMARESGGLQGTIEDGQEGVRMAMDGGGLWVTAGSI